MAFFSRYKSAPQLLNAGDNTYIIVGLRGPSDDEDDDDDEEEEEEEEEVETIHIDTYEISDLDAKRIDTGDVESASASGESAPTSSTLSVNNPMEFSPLSESESSPSVTHRTWKKKRRAPLPPDMSPVLSLRHSYAFDSTGGMRLRTSTDTDSVASENIGLFYQNSTDSEPLLPESARGSNFPGELAGVDNLYSLRSPRIDHLRADNLGDNLSGSSSSERLSGSLPRSPRERSKLKKIQDALRSPQIGRKKSKKEKNDGVKTSPKVRKSKIEEGSKSPRIRKSANFEPMPEMSDWIIACLCDDLEAEQEFEVKRIPDYDRYLSGLLQETDPSHVDYEDLAKAAKRVHSMVKEREDELTDTDNRSAMENVQDRFPHDDLRLRKSNSNSSINNNSSSSNSNDNALGHDRSPGAGSIINNNNNNNNNNKVESPRHNEEKAPNKLKGLSLRRRSAPSAVLFRTLGGHRSRSSTSLWSNAGMGKKDHDVISQFKVADSDSNRMFIMEGPVQLASGMQVQERYIFLFTDLLLVAKQKSSTAFKLKNRVQLCDMWIASCIEEVSETTRPPERSFVLGWPTTNVVATFPKAEHKDEWLLKLSERITEEKLRDEKKNIQLKVTPRDVGPSSCPACQMTINNVTQAKDVLLACLRQLSIEENEAKDYQLWVISGKEGSPYPLIGHETPFSIKLSQVRELTRSRSRDDLDKMTSGDLDTVVEDTNSSSGHRCEFFLKQKKTPKKNHLDNSSYQKSMKRSKKSPNIINTLLRKIRPPQPLVFGLPLADICDDDFQPPESILRLMVLVYRRGPEICGIMRRGNNAQLCKEIKEKIKSGLTYTVEDHQAPTAASVYKEFLRSIPGGLLMTEFHDQWVRVQKEEQDDVKIEKIKTILSQVPPAHYCLIKLSICLLQHLAKHCEVNCMGPSNLATCIAPSFCKLDLPNTKHASDLEHVQSSLHEITTIFTPLISFMIIKHIEIFGEDILEMFVKFGCESSPSSRLDEDRTDSGLTTNTEEEEEEEEEEDEMMVEDEDEMEEEDDEDYSNHQQLPKRHRLQLQKQQPQRQHIQRDSNSGTDSDSMHSVLSMPDTAMGLRRDDSSIDSLVDREYYPNETESSPKATKSHLSPSNLSRDSGLTLSDTQLYDEDALHHDMASKNYQRSASHFEGHELELHEAGYYSRSMDMRHDRRLNPVPPPRKRASKKPHDAHSIYELDHQGYHIAASSYHHRPPFKHSASTTQLDISQPRKGGELRPMLTHPPFGKRISSDSIGEEEETQGPQNPIDFNKIRKAPDIGTIVKTDSGTHLFLGDEMLPTKYNLGPAAVKMQQGRDRFIRQSSVTDSTPPVSPQSRYSQSSRDSVLSDSTYSMSRDGSVHSAPHTPDEPPGKSLSWMREHEPSFKQWDGRLAHSMNASTLPLSKSTSDLLGANYEEEEETSDQFGTGASNKLTRMYKPSSPKPWSRKSHEAEEIEMNRRPHFSLMVPSEDFSSEQASRRQSSPAYSRQTLAQQLVKGSPPPNVILKSLQPPQARRESVPMKASYDREIVDQVRRSSADFAENSPFDVAKSMSSIKPAEYFSVTSKEIMIPSPDDGDSSSSSSNVNKLKLSKYVSSNVDLPLTSKDKDSVLADSKRPDRPPNYQQALQRNFMLKHSIPVDITSDETEKQKEVSARAKALYEKSVQRYNEQRTGKPVEGHNSSQGQGVESKVGAASSSASITPLDNKPRSKTESVIDKSSSDGETIFAHSALSALPKNSHQLDVESSSAFLDMGTISRSLQEDVLNQRNALAKEELSSADGSFYGDRSISRTSSKLSDTGSSSGSSVTVSTLSRHSDSFSRHSDISNVSNVTVSSVTSSDSSTDAHSIKSQRRSGSELDLRSMAYSRHFRPVEAEKLSPPCDQEIPRRRSSGAIDEEDIYVTLQNKNPKQVYLESKRMFEEDDPVVQPSVSFSSHPSQEQSSTQPSSHSPSSSHLPLSSSQSPQHSPHISSSPKSSSLPSAEQTYSVKTSLEVPSSSLQRSRSDSAEHINKLGKLSPRLQTSNRLAQVTQGKGSSLEDSQLSVARFEEHSATVKKSFDKKPPSSDLSEHRHNFLKARSYFYHPEDDKLASPNASPRPSASSSYAASSLSSSNSSLPSNSAITVRKIPAENVANIPSYEDKTVDSGYNLSPRSRSNIPASRTAHDKHVDKKDPPPSASSVSQSKKEFPWSVKDLKSIYDKDKGPSSLSKGATSTQSTSTSSSSSSSSLTTRSQQQQQQQHRNPPPYQDPPPFRRMQDKYRLSTSSNSSAGSDQGSSARKLSTSSGNDPHRLGPQSNGLDGASYWSSSEDGYSSSLDRRSVKSSSSSNPDVEAISDYSNITYV